MVAGKPTFARPRGPRLLRRCPVCGEPVHFQAIYNRLWWMLISHPNDCPEGPKQALLAESQNGLGDWTAFAAGLGLPFDKLNEIAVGLGVLPPTEKTLGRLLGDLERRVILQAYKKVNGENDGTGSDL